MRVLLPYAGDVNPEVRAAVQGAISGHDGATLTERFVGANDTDYWRALKDEWRPTDDLVNVEHDIVVHRELLDEFDACPEEWCAYPYLHRNGERAPALGCTRFRKELMEREAGLLDWIGTWSDGRGAPVQDHSRPRIWNVLDVRLHRALTDEELRTANGRSGSYQWHVHGTKEVRHLFYGWSFKQVEL